MVDSEGLGPGSVAKSRKRLESPSAGGLGPADPSKVGWAKVTCARVIFALSRSLPLCLLSFRL